MPRVVMLTAVSSLAGSFRRGQAVDLGEALAASWIKAGYCRLEAKPPSPPAAPPDLQGVLPATRSEAPVPPVNPPRRTRRRKNTTTFF